MRQRHYHYRNYADERPPAPPEGETQAQRVARILDTMPPKIFNNPELRIKALKKAGVLS